MLHVGQLLGAEPLTVREVEAQLVRTDVRTGLPHVVAEPLAQRRVEEMGGGVISHRGQPRVSLHHCAHVHAGTDLALQGLERDGLVVAEPVNVDHAGPARGRLHVPESETWPPPSG